MKRRTIIAIGAVVAAGAAGLLLTKKGKETATLLATPAIEKVMELAPSETFLVRLTDLQETVPLSGSLRPLHQVSIKSQVAARLSEVAVREGQPVAKGDVIARFDLDELTSKLEEKQSNLRAAEAQLDLAEKNRARQKTLRGKGYASEVAADEAENSYQQAFQSVQAIQAQVEIAKEALGNAVVYAPISGFVSERPVNPGEKMGLDSKLISIVDLSEMELEAAIPSSDIARVVVDQPVEFRVQGLYGKSFAGTVARINPTTRAGSRSIPVYISVENTTETLRGGMFATGEIIVKKQAQVLAAPAGAIRGEGQDRYALTIVDGAIMKRLVRAETSAVDSELVAIIDGLTVGDTVISAPTIQLVAGTRVRISSNR